MSKAQGDLQVYLAEESGKLPALLGQLCSVPNGDLETLPHFIACATKGFPHDKKGVVEESTFSYFLEALAKGDFSKLKKIRLNGSLRLLSPTSVLSCELFARHASSYPLANAFSIISKEYAMQLDELFAMARLRDIPFHKWHKDKMVAQVCSDLSQWPLISNSSSANMPRHPSSQEIIADFLFRGFSPGDMYGPYVSQFLLLPYTEGMTQHTQQYTCLEPGKDFLVRDSDLLSALSGNVNTDCNLISKKYISTLRDGASIVRYGGSTPTRFAEIATMIILKLKVPAQSDSQLLPFEKGYLSLGVPDLLELLGRVSKLAQNASWYAKWVHVQARPEQVGWWMAHSDRFPRALYKSKQVQWAKEKYGSGLLPQAYPEGAPASPSSPSSAAAVIGACVTVIKAWFEGKTRLPRVWESMENGTELQQSTRWKAGSLTVENELDKLASNIAFFRCAAGVNTRADVERGIRLGERVALATLQEAVKRYEHEISWSVRRRDGSVVRISNVV